MNAKKMHSLLLLLLSSVCLTSCAQSSTVGLTEVQQKAILVDKLASDCNQLTAYAMTPGNWEASGKPPGGSGTEFSLYGDGGTLSLDVIPDGVGGANVRIAEVNRDVTNILLTNSGCRSLVSSSNY
jgi:hypothetical protein